MQARSWAKLPDDPHWADRLCGRPQIAVGGAIIRFSRCFKDPAKQITLLLTHVSELGLDLEFWISVHPRHCDHESLYGGDDDTLGPGEQPERPHASPEKGWVIRTAQGCSVLPTAGVQSAVDLVRAAGQPWERA